LFTRSGAQRHHQRRRSAHGISDEACFLNSDHVHEIPDKIAHRRENRTVLQLAFGLAEAGQIDHNHAPPRR
jgi:hypothetical protein